MDIKETCIIIVNYKNVTDTLECLISLLKLEEQNFCVIVVDNNSNNDSWEKLTTFKLSNENGFLDRLSLIKSEKNLGFAGGNNLAIRKIYRDNHCKWIWMLNNDTIVDKKALSQLLKVGNNSNGKLILGSKQVDFYNRKTITVLGGGIINRFTGLGKSVTANYSGQLDYIHGASMFFSTNLIKDIGFIPEQYFLYYEEVDFCFSAKKVGYKCSYVPESIIYHKEGGSTGSSTNPFLKSEFTDKYMIINRMRFSIKYLPCPLCVFAGIIYSLIIRIFRGQGMRSIRIFLALIHMIAKEYKSIKKYEHHKTN